MHTFVSGPTWQCVCPAIWARIRSYWTNEAAKIESAYNHRIKNIHLDAFFYWQGNHECGSSVDILNQSEAGLHVNKAYQNEKEHRKEASNKQLASPRGARVTRSYITSRSSVSNLISKVAAQSL